ncbi:hypothetical protein MMYC01_200417 [Madurella mycetomatis]|uniref:RNase T2-like C-terminal domain-containing protein n=1 Tax=Madurella mycetomatis TaxID=100816 RepID=A0A175WIS3_9PEZI|nr:hypothetical protein MMYC01_200417 [Madurella mycetomatis]
MTLKSFFLTLATALALTVPVTVARDFSGLGQIRTLYIRDDHEDLGCLTSQGRWTTDESQCGTFVAVRDAHDFKLTALDGGKCGVDVATFKCGQGVQWDVFATFGTNGPIPGREVLRYSQYGVMATNGMSPPNFREPALDIHFYSGAEKGKYAWLAWKPLDDAE